MGRAGVGWPAQRSRARETAKLDLRRPCRARLWRSRQRAFAYPIYMMTPRRARCSLRERPRAASRRWRSRLRRSLAAPSSTPIPCRSTAISPSSRRGRAKRRRRACRIGSTAMSMRRRTIRPAAGAPMRVRRSPTRARRDGCRSWWAAPGFISRRSRAGSPVSRRSRARCARACGSGRRRRAPPRCMPSSPRATPRVRAA